MIQNFFQEIKEHFEAEYPKEGCGVLAVQKGKPKWFPCTNVAEVDEEFILDSTEYLKIHRTSDIVGIVHSHPDGTSEASESDISYCNSLGIPYYIFSYPEMDLNVVQPKKDLTDLYGREYKFGVRDCFEAARDCLIEQGIVIPPRALFEDNWFKKGLDYFRPELIKDWGCSEVPLKDLQKNDVITFKVRSDITNHCGVFLGNDTFYHHAEQRLSCRENLYPFWIHYLDKAYRYDA